MRNVSPGADAVVWVADGVPADGLDYGTRLVQRLSDQGLDVVRHDLTSTDGTTPAARLHFLSGGSTSVNERSTWMPKALALTRSLIQGARREEHTLVGICLGSQIVAESLWPGGVLAGEQIRVGLTEVRWHDGENERIVVPAFHYEEIDAATVTGGGGEIVADNASSRVQGFRLGTRIWGLQFHPELEPTDVRRVVAHHRHTI